MKNGDVANHQDTCQRQSEEIHGSRFDDIGFSIRHFRFSDLSRPAEAAEGKQVASGLQ
jgi:hypothetical protein